jgi:hypothetical protein
LSNAAGVRAVFVRTGLPEGSGKSGIFPVKRRAATVFEVLVSVPLLKELGLADDGFGYKHGAPNEVVRGSLYFILLKTGEESLSWQRAGGVDDSLLI